MSTDPVVADFVAGLAPDRQAFVERLDELVRTAAPGLAPAMWGGALGYGSYHYRYASGREGDWYVVGIASTKAGLSIYLSASEDGSYLAEANQHRLGKVSVGRSCIRAKRLEDLDLAVLAELVTRTAALAEAGHVNP